MTQRIWAGLLALALAIGVWASAIDERLPFVTEAPGVTVNVLGEHDGKPVIQVTGVLYTIPSVAAFFLLLPITGRGNLTAIIALTSYTLLILFRNVVDGLAGVPEESRDAGRGMGLTDRQLLWRVEVPLALPAIMAGLRIALTTTVGLAALAFFAGAGGLGEQLTSDKAFKSNIVFAGALCVVMAMALDGLVLLAQRAATPWTRARAA